MALIQEPFGQALLHPVRHLESWDELKHCNIQCQHATIIRMNTHHLDRAGVIFAGLVYQVQERISAAPALDRRHCSTLVSSFMVSIHFTT